MGQHLYTYKYRIYPNEDQKVLFAKHFGCVRFIYNEFLTKIQEEYKTNKQASNENNNKAELPKLKKIYIWLKEVGSQSLQFAIETLHDALTSFRGFSKKGKKLNKKKGFPKHKKRHDKQSFHIKQNIKIHENKLIIPKFLEGINIVLHRELQGEIRYATISKNKAEQYHVAITVQKEILPLPSSNNVIGIDLNVKFNVDSNEDYEANPLPNNKYKQRLNLLHQKITRKEKGSKNKEKACKSLAKIYNKCHNIRENHLHRYSKRIINENQVICVEDLDVKSMLSKVNPLERKETRREERERHKNIADCGWYSLLTKLKYKALWYGRELIQIPRFYPSSQLCNSCGYQYKELPKDCKEWCCINCWNMNDRDYNSAKNILDEGLRKRTCGTQGIAYCPDVRPTVKSGLLVG